MFPRIAFRLPVRFTALILSSVAIIAFAAPLEARPLHHGKQARAHHGHHVQHRAQRRYRHAAQQRQHRRADRARHHRARASAVGAARMQNFRNANASLMQPQAGFGGSRLVAEARRHIGRNPTGRATLWCARFMNMVLERSGHRGTGSDMARSFASYGRRVSGPQVGAIAVMSRGRRGGHVGVVSGVDTKGNPIIVSGNHGRRVAEAVYSKSRVYAYVVPN